MVVSLLNTTRPLLQKEYHMTIQTTDGEGNVLLCVLTVRHSPSFVGSAVKFRAVLLTPDVIIGQEYHEVVQDNSTEELQI